MAGSGFNEYGSETLLKSKIRYTPAAEVRQLWPDNIAGRVREGQTEDSGQTDVGQGQTLTHQPSLKIILSLPVPGSLPEADRGLVSSVGDI